MSNKNLIYGLASKINRDEKAFAKTVRKLTQKGMNYRTAEKKLEIACKKLKTYHA